MISLCVPAATHTALFCAPPILPEPSMKDNNANAHITTQYDAAASSSNTDSNKDSYHSDPGAADSNSNTDSSDNASSSDFLVNHEKLIPRATTISEMLPTTVATQTAVLAH